MEFTIIFSWWVVPALITIISFIVYFIKISSFVFDGGLGDIGAGIFSCIYFGIAFIVSLISWLIYFVIF